jgi:GT2 family glycosyltransferase
LILRRDVFDRVGLFDEDLFLGNDDLKIFWRLRTYRSKLCVAKDVFVHHKHHVSFKSLNRSKLINLFPRVA